MKTSRILRENILVESKTKSGLLLKLSKAVEKYETPGKHGSGHWWFNIEQNDVIDVEWDGDEGLYSACICIAYTNCINGAGV